MGQKKNHTNVRVAAEPDCDRPAGFIMREVLQFVVPGNPVPKGRARTFVHKQSGRVVSMTPRRTREYETAVRAAFTAAYPGFEPSDGAFILCVSAFFQAPKKMKETDSALCPSHADWDNIGKIVSDSLNGVIWRDDRQVVDGRVQKFFSRKPHVVVGISRVG